MEAIPKSPDKDRVAPSPNPKKVPKNEGGYYKRGDYYPNEYLGEDPGWKQQKV